MGSIRVSGGLAVLRKKDGGAADRNRTGTDFTPRDFKSLVSTYSTTAAISLHILTHFPYPVKSSRTISLETTGFVDPST